MEENEPRREARAELRRARRICACLNAAILRSLVTQSEEDYAKVAHWQQITMTYYEVDDATKQEILQRQRAAKAFREARRTTRT